MLLFLKGVLCSCSHSSCSGFCWKRGACCSGHVECPGLLSSGTPAYSSPWCIPLFLEFLRRVVKTPGGFCLQLMPWQVGGSQQLGLWVLSSFVLNRGFSLLGQGDGKFPSMLVSQLCGFHGIIFVPDSEEGLTVLSSVDYSFSPLALY